LPHHFTPTSVKVSSAAEPYARGDTPEAENYMY